MLGRAGGETRRERGQHEHRVTRDKPVCLHFSVLRGHEFSTGPVDNVEGGRVGLRCPACFGTCYCVGGGPQQQETAVCQGTWRGKSWSWTSHLRGVCRGGEQPQMGACWWELRPTAELTTKLAFLFHALSTPSSREAKP